MLIIWKFPKSIASRIFENTGLGLSRLYCYGANSQSQNL